MSVLLAISALCFLIFFHELGHFVAARLCGVKVEIFSLGFGKKLICKTYQGTQYALSLIPLGGYVKLKGHGEEEASREADSFASKPLFCQIVILLAGVLFNFLLAWILFFALGCFGSKQLLPVVGKVEAGLPAQIAGIQINDKILKINSHPVATWDELSKQIAQSHHVNLEIYRDGKVLSLQVSPKIVQIRDAFGDLSKRAVIGIAPSGESARIAYGVLDSIRFAWDESQRCALLIFSGLKRLIMGRANLDEIAGPVGIVQTMAQAHHLDFSLFLMWVGLISINLGILNLLPIPALDGGQILLYLYSGLSGREMNVRTRSYLMLLGWGLILFLMALGLFNDMARILK